MTLDSHPLTLAGGRVSLSPQFQKFMDERYEKLRSVFDALDVSHSGRITVDDVKQGLKDANISHMDADVDRVLRRLGGGARLQQLGLCDRASRRSAFAPQPSALRFWASAFALIPPTSPPPSLELSRPATSAPSLQRAACRPTASPSNPSSTPPSCCPCR